MPLSDNISIGMENFTTLALRKLNFTDLEFHIKNLSISIEFQQENPTTGKEWFQKLGQVLIFEITGLWSSKNVKNKWGT